MKAGAFGLSDVGRVSAGSAHEPPSPGQARMRTLLICHDGASLDREGLVRWLASFSHVTGTVVIREPAGRLWKRVRREVKRVGAARFLDVLAYRAYYRIAHAPSDARWEAETLDALRTRYPDAVGGPERIVQSPNSTEAEAFIRDCCPDLVIARCKTLLKEQVFSIPRLGTFVMHPGICPEYRNAHGCFWAVATGDLENVGVTLLRIDQTLRASRTSCCSIEQYSRTSTRSATR
jgi:hypothetical protein